VLHTFDFQLVRIVVAHHLRLFISEKRRKKGAHTFHGICWNFLTDVRKLNVKNRFEQVFSSRSAL